MGSGTVEGTDYSAPAPLQNPALSTAHKEFLKSRGLRINEAKTKVSKATDGFDFLGWRFRVNSRGVFKSTPSSENYADIKAKVKATQELWCNHGSSSEKD